MATTNQSKQSSNLSFGIILAMIIALLVMMVIFAFGGGNMNQGPNPLGSQIAQAADPSDPKVQALMNHRIAFTDPVTLLADTETVRNAIGSLKDFQSTATDSAQKNMAGTLIEELTCIQTNSLSNKNKARQCAQDFIANKEKFQKLFTGNAAGIVATAKKIIDFNLATKSVGYGPGGCGHMNGAGPISSNGYPTYIDCSHFMGFVLMQNHVLTSNSLNTTGFFNESGKPDSKFTRVLWKQGSYLTSDDVLGAIKDGTIQPGDMFLTGSNYSGVSGSGANHIVMYLGGDPSDPKSIGQSTTTSKICGPQYTSVMNRLKGRRTVAVIRVKSQ